MQALKDALLIDQGIPYLTPASPPKQGEIRPGEAPKTAPTPFSWGRGSYFDKMAGRPGRPANTATNLDGLLELLVEPVGRQARLRAAEAIRAQA